MEKKISVKTIYLLLVISLGLVGLGIGSTYAVFTTSAEIDNPITLNSNLTYVGDLIDTVEIEISPGRTVSSTINITNSSGSTLNYTAWYLDEGEKIEVGTSSGTISGSLTNGNNVLITVDIRNNSSDTVTAIIGVASSGESIVLGSNMKPLPDSELSSINLKSYLTNLYKYNYNSSRSVTFANGTGMNYYAPNENLMNDGLDSSGNMTNDPYVGNIRYYGTEPDNYIYFNCDNYGNQSDSTCEKWRIVGIVDGKVKIIRNDPISELSYDYDYNHDLSSTTYSNGWSNSSLKDLLNGAYYNNLDTVYYNMNYSTGAPVAVNLNFNTDGIGINDLTKLIISESNWYIDALDSEAIYSSDAYDMERTDSWVGNIALINPSDYGYATDLNSCKQYINAYSNGDCIAFNWMHDLFVNNDSMPSWLLNGYSGNTVRQFYVLHDGVVGYNSMSYGYYYIYPTLYLDTDLSINYKGDGTEDNPYQINNPASPLSDFVYYLGSETSTVNSLRFFYDLNTDTNIDEVAPCAPMTLESDEILLTRYIGESSDVIIPDKYVVDGVEYNVTVLAYTSHVDDYDTYNYWYSGVFYQNDNIETVYLDDGISVINTEYYISLEYDSDTDTEYPAYSPSYGENNAKYMFEGCSSLLNVSNIPNSVTSLEGTFRECTSLITAPEIPNSVTNMFNTFSGCSNLVNASEIPSSVTNLAQTFNGCTNLTGIVKINSSNVSNVYRIFYGTTKAINVQVPSGSTTYTSIWNLTTSNGRPNNVTISTFTAS